MRVDGDTMPAAGVDVLVIDVQSEWSMSGRIGAWCRAIAGSESNEEQV